MKITTCDMVTLVASKGTKQKNYAVRCCICQALSILREKSAHAYPVQTTNVQHQDRKLTENKTQQVSPWVRLPRLMMSTFWSMY